MRRTIRAFLAVLAAFATVLLGNLFPTPARAEAPSVPIVSGTVVDADGVPITGATVTFCWWDDYLSCGEDTSTSAGAYSLGMDRLQAGVRYTVEVTRLGYWEAWLGGETEEPSELTDTNSFVVGTANIDLDPITVAPERLLTGKVVDPNGVARADVGVGLYAASDTTFDDAIGSDRTAGDGTFRIAIPRDAKGTSYLLGLREDDLVTQHQEVVLSQADLDLGNLTFTTAATSVVTGKVVDSSGNPLAGAIVSSLVWDGDGFEYYRSTESADDGSYSVRVRPGERFSILYEQSRYATVYLGGGRSRPTVQNDPVSTRLAGAAGEPNEPLPDAVLEPTFDVAGTILAGVGGRGVTEASVAAYPANHGPSDSNLGTWRTYESGDFELRLAVGSYDLVITTDDAFPKTLGRTMAVTITDDTDLGDILLEPVGVPVTGHLASAGGPVVGATVTAYTWQGDDGWEKGNQSVTDASGNYRLIAEAGGAITVRARKNGFRDGWLGSGLSKPAAPDATNSAAVTPALQLAEITLFPTSAKLGKVAGQDLEYCTNHTLAANDDDSTHAVRLPFPLKFYGLDYKTLYVNNNGNVSFGQPLSDYTPGDLTSADQEAPMIAPFFADVDTRNDASYEVTYGASADGKVFCVNWATVGYYRESADKLNIFQLLLTSRAGAPGRSAGDFDVTMNYDQVQWETGNASGGVQGLGGTSAGVGYTAGTGDPGTYFELAGSRTPGAFLDGSTRALVAHQLNSSQVGRYRFEIRNADANVQFGGLTGTLAKAADGQPVPGATLNACRIVDGKQTRCQSTRSLSDGSYSFPALPIGSYQVEVSPPGDLHSTMMTATVAVGQVTDLGLTALTAPQPMPSGTTLTSIDSDAGVPVVYYAEPLSLSIPNPCTTGASGSWKVLGASGEVLRSGSLTVSGDRLTATIPQLYPYSGSGRIETTVTCAGAPADSPKFDIYIDPSGTVYDQYGDLPVGAKVTLLGSDTSDGDFTAVPDGSTQLSPSNRANPVTLGSNGRFHWDATAAWYKVKVEKTGCDPYTSVAMEVPPERIDLALKLHCDRPVPTKALAITGAPTAGSTLTAVGATFAGHLESNGFRWLRDGEEVGTGSSYDVVEADYGHALKVEQALQAAPVTNSLDSSVLTFEVVKLNASIQLGMGKFTATSTPTISTAGALTEGAVLTANLGTWQPAANLALQWNRDGRAIAGATGNSYQLTTADLGKAITVSVTATRANFETVTVTSAAVLPPLHQLSLAPTPKVTGKAKAGSKLTATVGSWGPAPVSVKYEWLRGSQVVAGGLTYKVQRTDGGSRITFRVTGSKPGYADLTRSSVPTKVVPLSKLKAATPKIKGTPKVGMTLSVNAGRWTAGTSLSFQWYRGGAAVPGATNPSYLVSSADQKKALKVKVVGYQPGYKMVAKTSKATKKVT